MSTKVDRNFIKPQNIHIRFLRLYVILLSRTLIINGDGIPVYSRKIHFYSYSLKELFEHIISRSQKGETGEKNEKTSHCPIFSTAYSAARSIMSFY